MHYLRLMTTRTASIGIMVWKAIVVELYMPRANKECRLVTWKMTAFMFFYCDLETVGARLTIACVTMVD